MRKRRDRFTTDDILRSQSWPHEKEAVASTYRPPKIAAIASNRSPYEKEAVLNQWPNDKPSVAEVDKEIALLKARRKDIIRSNKNSHLHELPTSWNKSRIVTRVTSKTLELPDDSRFQELNGRLTKERMSLGVEEGGLF